MAAEALEELRVSTSGGRGGRFVVNAAAEIAAELLAALGRPLPGVEVTV